MDGWIPRRGREGFVLFCFEKEVKRSEKKEKKRGDE